MYIYTYICIQKYIYIYVYLEDRAYAEGMEATQNLLLILF